jgi:ParB family transcriptional regulator, chromosome partitioning protein
LARANSQHADQLVRALSGNPLSSRELRSWFEHYQKANRATRERLVGHPHLFLAALEQSIEQGMSERLRDGPEGSCEIDLRRINVLIRQVSKRLPNLCPLSDELITAASLVQANFEALYKDIKRYAAQNHQRDPQHRAHSQSAESQFKQDQPAAEVVA